MTAQDFTPQTVTLSVTNTSGKPLVYAAQQGVNKQGHGGQWLYFDAAGYTWKNASDFTAKNADTFIPDLAVGATDVQLPIPSYQTSGDTVGFRFYLAFPEFKSEAKDSGTLSAPDLLTSDFVFDKIEGGLASTTPDGYAWAVWDITAVDFVGLPMQLTKDGMTVGFKDGVTAKGLWKKLATLPAPYNTAPNSSTIGASTLRFFSAGHLKDADNCLSDAISAGITALAASQTVVHYGNYVYKDFSSPGTGQVRCQYSFEGSAFQDVTVSGIDTMSAFQGTIEQTGTSAQNNFGAILSAAICRGVLGSPDNWGSIAANLPNCATPWHYYPNGTASNSYSDMIHSYSIDGKNYAFPYDDYFGEEAGFSVSTGDSVALTILPFDGTMTAEPNPASAVKTGSLNITVPDHAIYPSGAGWDIGSIEIDGMPILPGNAILCGLNSTTVTGTFPSFPGVTMTIDMTRTDAGYAPAFSGSVGGRTVTGVVGLVYTADKRLLQFGQSASWITET